MNDDDDNDADVNVQVIVFHLYGIELTNVVIFFFIFSPFSCTMCINWNALNNNNNKQNLSPIDFKYIYVLYVCNGWCKEHTGTIVKTKGVMNFYFM